MSFALIYFKFGLNMHSYGLWIGRLISIIINRFDVTLLSLMGLLVKSFLSRLTAPPNISSTGVTVLAAFSDIPGDFMNLGKSPTDQVSFTLLSTRLLLDYHNLFIVSFNNCVLLLLNQARLRWFEPTIWIVSDIINHKLLFAI